MARMARVVTPIVVAPKRFVAIRMIVLANPGGRHHNFTNQDFQPNGPFWQVSNNFIQWMTVTTNLAASAPAFLDVMGRHFMSRGLTRITFLQGNRDPQALPSDRARSRPAGANAHFAWITYWTSMQDNQNAWSSLARPPGWGGPGGLWQQFLGMCYQDRTPAGWARRPQPGPPYDYHGIVNRGGRVIQGLGAGCLVEGFEVIYDRYLDANGNWVNVP